MKYSLRDQLARAKGFIFDMDGTIVNLEELNLTAFQEVIRKELDLELSNEEFQKHISGRGSLDGLRHYLTSIKHDPNNASALQDTYRKIKRNSLKTNFDQVVHIVDGAPQFLSRLHDQNFKTCLATSTGREFATTILEGTDLMQFFDHILTREDVKKIKPNPEIFELAMAKLGTTPETSIVFEDSLNGINSAKNAGVFCVGVLNEGYNEEYVTQADTVISSFSELMTEMPRSKRSDLH